MRLEAQTTHLGLVLVVCRTNEKKSDFSGPPWVLLPVKRIRTVRQMHTWIVL
jgi:hypothetical protein